MDNISIVLVEPQCPGNIGSVARAMRNTGFSNLALVNPVDFKNDEAYSMACKADELLKTAQVYPTLKDAIKGVKYVVGTTRRKGDVDGMYRHIEDVLRNLGYSEKGGYLLKAIMRTLRRLLGRTGLMEKEVNMIRGLCTRIEEMVGKR
ncbi:MAG: hypothetical protein HY878_00690 [Deltaproteobacteria bacterium]|nr:hypothetical protein [Deltaproteobacteria bacterium]